MSLIYYAGENIEPEKVAIGNLSTTQTGEIVTVEGEVMSSSFIEGNLFLDLKGETGSISVSNFGANQNFREGETVSVEGEVTIYEGELSMVARSIERVK